MTESVLMTDASFSVEEYLLELAHWDALYINNVLKNKRRMNKKVRCCNSLEEEAYVLAPKVLRTVYYNDKEHCFYTTGRKWVSWLVVRESFRWVEVFELIEKKESIDFDENNTKESIICLSESFDEYNEKIIHTSRLEMGMNLFDEWGRAEHMNLSVLENSSLVKNPFEFLVRRCLLYNNQANFWSTWSATKRSICLYGK